MIKKSKLITSIVLVLALTLPNYAYADKPNESGKNEHFFESIKEEIKHQIKDDFNNFLYGLNELSDEKVSSFVEEYTLQMKEQLLLFENQEHIEEITKEFEESIIEFYEAYEEMNEEQSSKETDVFEDVDLKEDIVDKHKGNGKDKVVGKPDFVKEKHKLIQKRIEEKRSEIEKHKSEKKDKVKDKFKNKDSFENIIAELKEIQEVSAELQAYYELLVEESEVNEDYDTAIELQKSIIEKGYQFGERNTYKKLGQLLKKVGNEKINAFVNGKSPNFEIEPFVENGTTLVPIRAIVESLGAEVKWNKVERKITITKDGNVIELFLNKTESYVNGNLVVLDTPPKIYKNIAFLPLRFISENLNSNVEWQPDGKVIIIEDKTEAEVDLIIDNNGEIIEEESNIDDSVDNGNESTSAF